MGNKVDLIEELRSRIAYAVSNGPLSSVKRVMVGSVEEARKQNDLPIINIQLVRGRESPAYRNNIYVDDMVFSISLVHTKLYGQNNTLYKTSDSTGVLYSLELLLNAVDETTGGAIDNTFSQKANSLKVIDYSIDETSDVIVVYIEVTIQTKQFIAGGR